MRARARRLAGGVVVACLSGCAMLSPASRAAEELLEKADALAASGNDGAAITAYAEVVGRYPGAPAATRARVLRDALGAVEKLRAELRARESELGAREAELRVRESELGARDTELRARESELRARASELEGVRRVLASRDTALARVQSDLAVRDLELTRLRGEVAARQTEVTRLNAESESLRAAIDQLKRIDLRLEQEGAKRR